MVGDPHASMDSYALTVGRLCNEWADLERVTCHVLMGIAKIPETPSALAVMRCYGFRDHLSALKVAAVASGAHETRVDRLVETVDYIHHQLRPLRNSFVHDQWIHETTPPSIVRVNFSPKIIRDAKKGRVLIPGQKWFGDIAQISDATDEILRTKVFLAVTMGFFMLDVDKPLPVSLGAPPPRRYLPPPPEKLHPKHRSSKGRKSPPQSSPR